MGERRQIQERGVEDTQGEHRPPREGHPHHLAPPPPVHSPTSAMRARASVVNASVHSLEWARHRPRTSSAVWAERILSSSEAGPAATGVPPNPPVGWGFSTSEGAGAAESSGSSSVTGSA